MEIYIIIVTFIALVSFIAAFRAWMFVNEILEELDLKKIKEILPAIKEIKKEFKIDDKLLSALGVYFQVWKKSIMAECKQLVADKIKLEENAEKVENVNEIKKKCKEELYNQSQIFKKKVTEQKEKHANELDEQNTLIKKGNLKLKAVSWKLNKIVEVVIKQNPKEDIEDILKEFDAFYVINAALIKWERIYDLQVATNKRQSGIHKKLVSKHFKDERVAKSIYDRYRNVCKKHNEPLEVRKQTKRKPKNNWLNK